MTVEKTKKGVPIKREINDAQSKTLTENNLQKSCHDSYKHDMLNTQTDDEKAYQAYQKQLADRDRERQEKEEEEKRLAEL